MNNRTKSTQKEFDYLSPDEKAQAIIDDAFERKFVYFDRAKLQKSDNEILSSYIHEFKKIMAEQLDDDKKNELGKILYKEISIYKKYSGLKLYEIYNAIGYHYQLGLNEVDYVKKYIIEPYYGREETGTLLKFFQPFRTYVKALDDYLGGNGCICKERILGTFMERKPDITSLESVFQISFRQKYSCEIPRMNRLGIDAEDFTSVMRSITECDACSLGKHCNVKSHLMFWLLFMAGIDEEDYTENLRMIADLAFVLGFDEEHLKDWVIAAKGALKGKEFEKPKLKELNYNTAEAKEFFIRNNQGECDNGR